MRSRTTTREFRLTKRQRIAKAWKRFRLRISGVPGEARPMFVFGAQRSGTTMLLNTIQGHVQVEYFDENDEEAFDHLRLRDLEAIDGIVKRSRGKLNIFKPICDSQHARKILDGVPSALGLWIYRRYEDVVNSALRNFDIHREFLRWMIEDPERARWRAENVTAENMQLVRHYYDKGASDPSSRALIWYLRNFQYYQQKLDQDPRVLLVCYERLVTDPHAEFSRVFKFSGLSGDSGTLAKVHSRSIKKNKVPEIEPEIRQLCDGLFARLDKTRDEQGALE